MAREGFAQGVTFKLTPEHEMEPAMRTSKGVASQAEGIANAETGPSFGFKEGIKGPCARAY